MYIYMYIYIYILIFHYLLPTATSWISLEPPQSFSFEGNVSQSWRLWLKHFEFYVTATEKERKK